MFEVSRDSYAKLDSFDRRRAHQDALDSFFGERIIAIRNALRDLGWTGVKYGTLSRDGLSLDIHYELSGRSANILGIELAVAPEKTKDRIVVRQPGTYSQSRIKDDLSLTASQLAARINTELALLPALIVDANLLCKYIDKNGAMAIATLLQKMELCGIDVKSKEIRQSIEMAVNQIRLDFGIFGENFALQPNDQDKESPSVDSSILNTAEFGL